MGKVESLKGGVMMTGNVQHENESASKQIVFHQYLWMTVAYLFRRSQLTRDDNGNPPCIGKCVVQVANGQVRLNGPDPIIKRVSPAVGQSDPH